MRNKGTSPLDRECVRKLFLELERAIKENIMESELDMKKFWIVGKAINGNGRTWEFGGLFETEELAIRACYTDDYFIAPANLNELLDDESEHWKGSYYPLLEDRFGNFITK